MYSRALAIKADMHEPANSWGAMLGNEASALAKTGDLPGARALWKQAGEKYAQALAIKADEHEAANNWGVALLHEVQELIVTEDMHQRKQLMFERSDAFVALPGGIGTLEELVEQLTWSQLGRHNKPIVLANIDGFWDPLCRLLDHMREQAFIRDGMRVHFITVDRAEDILPAIAAAAPERPKENAEVIGHM